MKQRNKAFLFVISFLLLTSCGVKSRPLPPEVPAPLGRGEPTKAPDAKKKNTIKNKYNFKDEDGQQEAE